MYMTTKIMKVLGSLIMSQHTNYNITPQYTAVVPVLRDHMQLSNCL